MHTKFVGRRVRLTIKICRWVSSGFIALAASGILLLSCSVIYEELHLQDRLGVDDDVCLLTLLAGPLCMPVFHRRYHSTRWLPWTCAVLGIVGLAGAAVTFTRMAAASAAHVPTGPLSGIGYVIMQVLSVYVGGVALAAALGGLFGVMAHRMDRTAEPLVQADGEDAHA